MKPRKGNGWKREGVNRRFEFELRTGFGLNGGGFVLAMHPTM